MERSEITALWSPELEPAALRWQARARVALADFNMRDPVLGLHNSGLLKMFKPARNGGAAASFSAMVSVFETLAAHCADASLLMAGALAGSCPILMLGSDQQKKAWLGKLVDGDAMPPLLVAPENALHDGLAFVIGQDGMLRGRGRWVGAIHASAGAVVFTQKAQDLASKRVSAFFVPQAVLGAPAYRADADEEGALYGVLALDVHLDPGLMLGAAGGAQRAMETSLALYRIAVAAQAIGVSIAAYEEALSAAREDNDISSPFRAALKLAHCVALISSSRMALYEVARAADAGKDIVSLSAVAALSAHACADSVISASLQIMGDRPSSDLVRLHALLRARQLHRVGAGAPKEQAVLLADVIAPLPKAVQTGTYIMSKPVRGRSGETPDRVSEILDAAAEAFTQQSYDATTLDYIGDAIGVTKGSIYYHYRSKADLFVAVYRRAMEINIETVEPIARQADSAAVDRLYRMAYAHSLQVMKHLSYQRVAVQGLESHLMSRVTDEQRASLEEVISLRDQYEKLFVQTIQEAISAGELPQQNPRLAVKPLFGAINWTTMWYQPRDGETPEDRERIAAQLASFVVSGLKQSYEPVPVTLAPALSDDAQ